MSVRTLKEKRDELVLVATDLAVIAAPYGTTIPKTLFNEDGSLKEMPDGWLSLGEVEKAAGTDISPERKFSEIEGYGSLAARRRILQSEGITLGFTQQEVRKIALKMQNAVNDSHFEQDGVGFKFTKFSEGGEQYWSVFVIGFDGTTEKPIYIHWDLPKVAIADGSKSTWKTDSPVMGAMSLTAFEDPKHGLYSFGINGAGWAELSRQAGFEKPMKAPQTITITGNPTGGTFTVSVGSVSSEAIAYNASAADVQAAVEKISSVGTGNVFVEGPEGGPYTIAVAQGIEGGVTVSGTGLTGGSSPKATIK